METTDLNVGAKVRRRRSSAVLLGMTIVALWSGGLQAAGLPPIEGELTGKLNLLVFPGAPPLQWRVTATTAEHDVRHVTLVADGAGTKLTATVDLDPRTYSGRWELGESQIEASAWYAAIAPRLGKSAPELVLSGPVRISGQGELRAGQPIGVLKLHGQELAVKDVNGAWSLEGIEVEGELEIDAAAHTVRSTSPAVVTVQTITTNRFGARNLRLVGRLESKRRFALSSGRLEIAGGDMIVSPCDIDLSPFHISADVTFNRIGLQDVAALVPQTVKSAFGRVDGAARVTWSTGTGFELGKGHISLRGDEHAEVTLRPFPGLFTARLPEWVINLPERFVHSSLPSLRKAELGDAPIDARMLDVTFSPEPDAEGRTAVVHLVGVPKGARSTTPVDVTANVHGPLSTFLQLTSDSKVSLSVKK